MAGANVALVALNRGLVSPQALARVDIQRIGMSAETQTNWMPKTLGPMMLRPGMAYKIATASNAQSKNIPFVYSQTDTAWLEITNLVMRPVVSEALITRASVSTAITNGTFTTDLTGWTSADESGATSAWVTGDYLSLIGTRYNAAIRYQQVTVATADQNVEHAVTVIIQRSAVTIKIGSTLAGTEYFAETALAAGTYSLRFTPTGSSFYIQFENRSQYAAYVDSVAIESSGTLSIAAPWTTSDLANLRWCQSGDVIFVASAGDQQRKIMRLTSDSRSWGIAKYEPEDGPFRIQNTSTLRLTPTATTGDTTLTASRALFASTHVGALFKIGSVGQIVTASVTAAAQWSNAIRVVSVGAARTFNITISGTWTATVTLQRSLGATGSWVAVNTYTVNTTTSYNDGLDNQIVYYRIGVDTGNFTSGTAVLQLDISSGSISGVCRVTAYTSSTSVSIAVLSDLGGTSASEDWSESVWSDYRGWPSATANDIYEGRLWWFGKNWWIGSVSDAYSSFDDSIEGDSAPIVRTIGSGPVDTINWGLGLQRLIAGAQGAEISARSSSFDEPLTPTNFNLKDASTQGSAISTAVKIDERGVYIDRSTFGLFLLDWNASATDYTSTEMSVLYPDIGSPGFTHLAVQRHPDTRIHAVRSDGTVCIIVFNKAEDVKCIVNFTPTGTSAAVEDIFVLPGTTEDAVYYQVKRTINSSTKRYIERFALESECVGGTLNKQADSFIIFSGTAAETITGLSHLVGESVVVWADGKCLTSATGAARTFTVSSGGTVSPVTGEGIPVRVTSACVGLAYTAQYKSSKLAYAAQLGTALGQHKQVEALGLSLYKTHAQGLKFGPDFTTMRNLPLIENGKPVDADSIWSQHDFMPIEFPGDINNDARVCLQAASPRPATVMALMVALHTDERRP